MLEKLNTYLPFGVALIAISVLFGWATESRALIQVLPAFAAMQPNTALAFLLLSAALLLSRGKVSVALAATCFTLCSLTLLQYLLDRSFHIDNLLFDSYVNDRSSDKGRMSEATALVFVFLSSSVLVQRSCRARYLPMLLDRTILLLACMVAFKAIAGYLFAPEIALLPEALQGMALHTALAHFMLGGVLVNRSREKFSELLKSRQSWSSYICLLSGILLSIGLWTLSLAYESDAISNDLRLDAKLRSLAIQNQFNEDQAKLETVERFFAASNFVSAQEFEIFVSPFFAESTSMLAVDWTPRIPTAQAADFLKAAKLPRLKQLSPEITTEPHSGAKVYYPILYTSPRSYEKVARGFDHYADPPRFRAMNLARETQSTAGTEPIPLFRSPEHDKAGLGMLVVTPVFKNANAPSPEGTAAKELEGYIVGIFRFDGILRHTLEGWEMSGLTFELFGKNDVGKYISVFKPKDSPIPSDSALQKRFLRADTIPLSFTNRDLMIQFTATPAYIQAKLSAFPITLLFASLSLTLLTACYLLYLSKQRLRIEELLAQNDTALLDLEEREQLFKQLAERAPIGIFKTDARGACTYVNPAWLEMTDLGEEEGLGFGWAEAIHPEDLQGVQESWKEAVDSSGSYSRRFRFLMKNGTSRWVIAEAAPVTREDNEVIGYVGSTFDFTELNRALEVKNDFLANMSHEIRTPMNSILGFTKRLLKKDSSTLGERSLDALNTIDRNAEHLLSLINDILDLTKIESGKATLEKDYFDITELLSDSVAAAQPLADAKNIPIVFDGQPERVLVNADRTKLAQVINNLLSNAVKYTDEGEIRIKRKAGEEHVILAIIDSGIGVKEEDIGKLFRKFSQLDSAAHRREGGTGLGLCLVREYVEMHGGTVEVESQWGVGSTFTVTIPRATEQNETSERPNGETEPSRLH